MQYLSQQVWLSYTSPKDKKRTILLLKQKVSLIVVIDCALQKAKTRNPSFCHCHPVRYDLVIRSCETSYELSKGHYFAFLGLVTFKCHQYSIPKSQRPVYVPLAVVFPVIYIIIIITLSYNTFFTFTYFLLLLLLGTFLVVVCLFVCFVFRRKSQTTKSYVFSFHFFFTCCVHPHQPHLHEEDM